jgi:uncharacterized surface anchored protein
MTSLRLTLISAIIAATACGRIARTTPARTPGPGAVGGLVRNATTGAGVEGARVVLRRPGSLEPVQAVSDDSGAYFIADLPPGPYAVTAYVQESPIGEQSVTIANDQITSVDFAFGVETDAPIDLNAPSMAPLWRYRPPGADHRTGVIEGTVADTRQARLPGAVISVIRDGGYTAEQTFSDDHGRFQVAGLAPGSYTVSAYYAVLTRAQMEVRRNRVHVVGGEVVVVPLWLETDSW